jgi:hypothetical protein
MITGRAAGLGATGMVLAAPPAGGPGGLAGRYAGLGAQLGFVAVLEDDVFPGTWTEVALGPGFRACFVARPEGAGWRFATSYDPELVVECALALMARLPPAPAPR